MAKCEFTLPMPASPATVLSRAREETLKRGGQWGGDVDSGTFLAASPLGAIEGTYRCDDGVIYLVIAKKPRLLPCGAIEKVARLFLSGK